MIDYIAAKVVRWISKYKMLSVEDSELYEYVFRNLIFSAIPILMVLLVGFVTNMILEGLILITPFILLRKFSGGFHLRSRSACMALSLTLLASFMFLSRVIVDTELHALSLIIVGMSAAAIFLLSPVDSGKRKLSEQEITFFMKAARVIDIILFSLFLLLASLSLWQIAIPLGMGMTLTALLQLPCISAKI